MTITITAVKGDITNLAIPVDVIVNAANRWMRGGGGVDGAIHRAAGPKLLDELKVRCPDENCPVGEAVWTQAHDINARYIVHVVGPDYRHEDQREPRLLASCYTNAIDLADQAEQRSVAFPLISSGIFAWPKHEAVDIAIQAIRAASEWAVFVENVDIVCFDQDDYDRVRAAITEHATRATPNDARTNWQSRQIESIATEEITQ